MVFFFAVCLAFAFSVHAAPKLIDWSWSNPTLDYLEKNLPRMNEECPFLDGLVIRMNGKTIKVDGKDWTPSTGNAWSRRAWTYEMFEDFEPRPGVTKRCVDYTLMYEGPGKYFTSEAIEAHKRGIPLYTMANTGGLSWDVGVVPYEPCPYQWKRRYDGMESH